MERDGRMERVYELHDLTIPCFSFLFLFLPFLHIHHDDILTNDDDIFLYFFIFFIFFLTIEGLDGRI